MTQFYDNYYILLFGIPGAGKGTVSAALSKKYKNVFHLAAGDVFRRHKRANSKFYHSHIKKYIENGLLVPSEITNKMMEDELKKIPKGAIIIFDGYPRRFDQMEYLEKVIKNSTNRKKGPFINLVINIWIEKEAAKSRILNRRICSNCGATYKKSDAGKFDKCIICGKKLILLQRKDDTSAVYEKRYKWTISTVQPIIDYYKKISGENFVEIKTTKETTISETTKSIEGILLERNITLIKND